MVNSVFAVVIETVLIAGRTRMEGNSDGRTRVEDHLDDVTEPEWKTTWTAEPV